MMLDFARRNKARSRAKAQATAPLLRFLTARSYRPMSKKVGDTGSIAIKVKVKEADVKTAPSTGRRVPWNFIHLEVPHRK
jgi:hypothetical protein